MPVDGECVKQSCARKQSMVRRGEHASHDDGVDEATSCRGASHLKYKRERGSPCVFAVKVRGGVRDVEAEDENCEDVEEEDAPEDVSDDFGHGSCWIFGLTCNAINMTQLEDDKSRIVYRR